MRGKIGLFGVLALFGLVIVIFGMFSYIGHSAEYQTGSTTMSVTVRGYVSILVSQNITSGISFDTQDPNTNDNNATGNDDGPGGGTGYNLTVGTESTVNVNFTHAANRTNLTTGSSYLGIGNVTTNSNSTANDGANLMDPSGSTSLSNSWKAMEDCENLGDGANCWITYFLDVPVNQPPGNYNAGYCWCGRQTGTSESNCGTCT